MKNIFLLGLILFSFKSYSQISFEKGYFFNNDNKKIDCLIKNVGWLNNPTEFEYRITSSSDIKTAKVDAIKEFGVANLVYKKFTLELSRFSDQLNKLTYQRNPEYTTESIFLKQLVKGDTNLYVYYDGNFTAYFFNRANETAEQLIFKKFLSSDFIVQNNNFYKQQLLNNLKCESITYKAINKLKYSKNDLTNIFKAYNECKGFVYTEENKTEDNGSAKFKINAKAGISSNSFQLKSGDRVEFDFSTIIGFQFGAEAELIMPFNNNKWSILIAPTYNHFQSETTNSYYDDDRVTINYNTFELPLGIRHYLFLNERSKLFLGLSYVLIFDLNSEITSRIRRDLNFHKETNIAFSLGYNFNNRYFVEARYDFERGDLFPYSRFKSKFKTVSLLFGVNIL